MATQLLHGPKKINLTFKTTITTKVACFCPLKCFRRRFHKQCRPNTCYIRERYPIIGVHTVYPISLRKSNNVMLSLHYVPGSHGSHGSQKLSSPWCVFSRSVKVCRNRDSPARYGLSRMVLRLLPACHVLLRVLLRCDQVLLRLSSSVKVFYGDEWCLSPNMPTV